MPKLSDTDVQICEGKLTVEECYKSLQLFESNKSPGNDGLTVEFYRAFWGLLGQLLVDSLNYSYDHADMVVKLPERSHHYPNRKERQRQKGLIKLETDFAY